MIGIRGGSRTAATSKMERFVIIVNGFQPLTIITKRSILDVAAVLDPPLSIVKFQVKFRFEKQILTCTMNHPPTHFFLKTLFIQQSESKLEGGAYSTSILQLP